MNDMLEKMNQLLRMGQIQALEKPLVYQESGPYVRIQKIILDNLVNKQEIYEELYKRTSQLIGSLQQSKERVSFYLLGDKSKNEISILMNQNAAKLANLVESVYPDIKLQMVAMEELSQFERNTALEKQAFATLVPSYGKNKQEAFCMTYTNLVRAMRGRNFVVKVTCKQWSADNLEAQYELLLKERTKVSSILEETASKVEGTTETKSYQTGTSTNTNDGVAILVSRQEGRTTNQGETYTTGITNSDTINVQKTQYEAVQYDVLLETQIERVENMRIHGAYVTTIQLFAEDAEGMELLKQGFHASIEGKLVEPLQYHAYKEKVSIVKSLEGEYTAKHPHILYGNLGSYVNLLTAEETAKFFTPYLEEQKGFVVERAPRFLQNAFHGDGFVLGELMDYEKVTGNSLYLNQNDINKHILVAGMTGTGKTNTIFSLLKNVDKPFLIIEPAKTEYRVLKSLVKDLRVYTLGREHISPFRMNPFQFNPEKISLQEHIDNLKVIFSAAFTMYASMPNILEQCLINIYTQKGWSLITSENVLCKDERIRYYFPTLEDLYAEIDAYIDSLGYAKEQQQNIRAALLVRINSLMTGAKGFMLNTHKSIDIKELLSWPTVLELEGVADDTEKALVIGFIMLGIYEYLKGNLEGYAGGLKHIIVMEEAHRLFSNVANSENQEQVNVRGKAVETLSNMLCEIRAYGEGFIIVDQVPTKLAEDVLKNTNTKVIHRLVSKDDCEYIGKSIAMKEKNLDAIAKLKVGQALVYHDKLDGTAHITVNFNKDQYHYQSNQEIREQAETYNAALGEECKANPIVETLLNYQNIKEEILQIVKGYAEGIINERRKSLQEYYNKMKEDCIRLTMRQGFELEDGYGQFVYELVMRSFWMMLSRSNYANNIAKKYELRTLISCSMKLAVLPEGVKEKHLRAFKVRIKNVRLQLN